MVEGECEGTDEGTGADEGVGEVGSTGEVEGAGAVEGAVEDAIEVGGTVVGEGEGMSKREGEGKCEVEVAGEGAGTNQGVVKVTGEVAGAGEMEVVGERHFRTHLACESAAHPTGRARGAASERQEMARASTSTIRGDTVPTPTYTLLHKLGDPTPPRTNPQRTCATLH